MKKTPFIITLLCWGLIAQAQIPNAKTETVRIAGNCGMCKSTIETSASVKNEASVSWNADHQQARITYDSLATNLNDILKRVAYAGYDSDRYLAPAAAYEALETCCQYERAPAASIADDAADTEPEATSVGNAIDPVYQAYAALKDVLVAGKPARVPPLAIALGKLLDELSAPEAKQAAARATSLAGEKSLDGQRNKFVQLSEAMYAVAKANPPSSTLYYQHCPMYNKGKGAYWLSMEKAIRNPYYGETMLTCGSVKESIGGKK